VVEVVQVVEVIEVKVIEDEVPLDHLDTLDHLCG
jgi:hypothetical protein